MTTPEFDAEVKRQWLYGLRHADRSEGDELLDRMRAYLASGGDAWDVPPPMLGGDGQPLFSVAGSLIAIVDESTDPATVRLERPERKMADIQGDMRQLIRDISGWDRFGEVADRAVALLGEAYDIGTEEAAGP